MIPSISIFIKVKIFLIKLTGKYYNYYVGEIYNAKNVPELKKFTDIFENYKKHIKKF